MTNDTLQFIIKVFSAVVGIALLLVIGTLAVIIFKDGGSPLVGQAFSDLVTLTQWITGIIGGVLILHPITVGVSNLLLAHANYKNNVPVVTPVTLVRENSNTSQSEVASQSGS